MTKKKFEKNIKIYIQIGNLLNSALPYSKNKIDEAQKKDLSLIEL